MSYHLSLSNRKSVSLSSRSHQYSSRKRLSQGKQIQTIHTGRYSMRSPQNNLPRYRSYQQKSKSSKNVEKNEQIQQQNERLFQKLAKILNRNNKRKFKMPKNNKLIHQTINIQKNQQSNQTIQTMLNVNEFFDTGGYKRGHIPEISNKINVENQNHKYKFQHIQNKKQQSHSGIKFPIIPLSNKNFQTLPIIWEEDPQYIYQIEDDVFTIRIVKKKIISNFL